MDWEDRLDDWELKLELNAQLEGSDWGHTRTRSHRYRLCRAALRSWYQTGQIPSRLTNGPHGPQRLAPYALVAARAEASPRPRRCRPGGSCACAGRRALQSVLTGDFADARAPGH
jgi:transposase